MPLGTCFLVGRDVPKRGPIASILVSKVSIDKKITIYIKQNPDFRSTAMFEETTHRIDVLDTDLDLWARCA